MSFHATRNDGTLCSTHCFHSVSTLLSICFQSASPRSAFRVVRIVCPESARNVPVPGGQSSWFHHTFTGICPCGRCGRIPRRRLYQASQGAHGRRCALRVSVRKFHWNLGGGGLFQKSVNVNGSDFRGPQNRGLGPFSRGCSFIAALFLRVTHTFMLKRFMEASLTGSFRSSRGDCVGDGKQYQNACEPWKLSTRTARGAAVILWFLAPRARFWGLLSHLRLFDRSSKGAFQGVQAFLQRSSACLGSTGSMQRGS